MLRGWTSLTHGKLFSTAIYVDIVVELLFKHLEQSVGRLTNNLEEFPMMEQRRDEIRQCHLLNFEKILQGVLKEEAKVSRAVL
jgi:hypothetical protein